MAASRRWLDAWHRNAEDGAEQEPGFPVRGEAERLGHVELGGAGNLPVEVEEEAGNILPMWQVI